ncbi:MAG: hypothetical protein KAW12_19125 [Candidatus Aminicenantes bacterium]|nr:hypothetical protein [Candidatus Aminicenantes bacterium]
MNAESNISKDTRSTPRENPAYYKRKIMQPPRRGTVSVSQIKKIIKDIKASRSVSN